MLENVAVVDEAAGDAILQERHDELDLARLTIPGIRHVDRVHHPPDIVLLTVGLDYEEVSLVDVEHMVLSSDVAHRPLLDVTHLRHRVVTIGRPLFSVEIERIAILGL